jgi:long-chain acyl-CoA synthetase
MKIYNEFPWLAHYDAGVPSSLNYPEQPLFYFLEESARKYPSRICTIFNHEMLSYTQLLDQSIQLSLKLVEMGIKKGDRIGLLMPNLPEFVIAFYGSIRVGGVVMAFNPQYTPQEIEYQANDAGIELLFVTAPLYPQVKAIQSKTRIKRIVVIARNEQNEIISGIDLDGGDINWLAIFQAPLVGDKMGVGVGPDDEAIYQYTGGTTGIPKCAVGLHRNLVANTVQFRHWLVNGVDGQETLMLAIPMYHVYGMLLGMSLGVMCGASMVLIANPRDLDNLLDNLEKHRVSIFPGVPSLYNAIIQHPAVQHGRYQLQTIKACISGSAPLPQRVKAQFESLTGGKLVEGYGLSEAPTATHCNPILGENRAGSIGLPLPDVDCRIISLEDGITPLRSGLIGELILRGPQVMAGYHEMPDETRLALKDGWLYTGDIARMDEDGFFYLVDRKKDLIKSGGFQVWPNEVEKVILTHPKVSEAAVAGVNDPWRSEMVKAWIVVKKGESLQAESIREWCAKSLAGYKIPRLVEFRNTLPRTTSGKILRRELVRQHSNAGQ